MTTTLLTKDQVGRVWAYPELYDNTLFSEATPETHNAYSVKAYSSLEEIAKRNHWTLKLWHHKQSGRVRWYLNDESGESVFWMELNGNQPFFVHSELSDYNKRKLQMIVGQYRWDENKWYCLSEGLNWDAKIKVVA